MRPALSLPGIAFIATLVLAPPAAAQEPAPAPTRQVPPVVALEGTLPGLEGPVTATLSLYPQATGGEALWAERQTVTVAPGGRFVVLLGATQPGGLPPELFADGDARWLGVRVDGQDEAPRILITSVAYALKAEDAATVGGKPLSAFILAGETTGVGADGLTYVNPATLSAALSAAFAPTATAGTAQYIAMFTNATDLGNSVMYQVGTSIGVNTLAPASTFHVMAPAAPAAYFDVYNNLLGALPVVYRAARGTPSMPAAVQTGDILGGLAVRGFGTSTFSAGRGQVMFRAAEHWTDEANGTYLQFTTTPLGSGDWQERMRIDPAGNVGIGTTIPTQKLTVAGAIESTAGGFRFPDGTTQATAGGTYTAGVGLSLAANTFSVNFGGAGSATTASRSDHTQPWTSLTDVPAGFADGVDNDTNTTYTAGTGLILSSTVFSVNFGGSGTAGTASRSDHHHDAAYINATGDTMTGTLALSSPLTCSGCISAGNLSAPLRSAFEARMSANQSVPYNSTQALLFNAEGYDANGDFNPTTGTFTAPESGFYHFTCSFILTTSVTSNNVRVYVASEQMQRYAPIPAYDHLTMTVDRYLAAGTAVTCSFYQLVDTTLTVASSMSRFSGFRVH